jgi:hypothetical protein
MHASAPHLCIYSREKNLKSIPVYSAIPAYIIIPAYLAHWYPTSVLHERRPNSATVRWKYSSSALHWMEISHVEDIIKLTIFCYFNLS